MNYYCFCCFRLSFDVLFIVHKVKSKGSQENGKVDSVDMSERLYVKIVHANYMHLTLQKRTMIGQD